MAPCRVILVGMMGSGKTTVGRTLARVIGWPYHDNDELLRHRLGLSARQLLEQQGEPGLRAGEAAALADGLALPGPAIIGAAAGTILSPEARRSMAAGFVVWLRARPETLAQRATGGWHRPWLEADPAGWLAERSAEREPFFHAVSDVVVDVDDASPDEIARTIRARIGAMSDCSGLGLIATI